MQYAKIREQRQAVMESLLCVSIQRITVGEKLLRARLDLIEAENEYPMIQIIATKSRSHIRKNRKATIHYRYKCTGKNPGANAQINHIRRLHRRYLQTMDDYAKIVSEQSRLQSSLNKLDEKIKHLDDERLLKSELNKIAYSSMIESLDIPDDFNYFVDVKDSDKGELVHVYYSHEPDGLGEKHGHVIISVDKKEILYDRKYGVKHGWHNFK